jgi:glycosyltransferase involved in cell wall biosynthesis
MAGYRQHPAPDRLFHGAHRDPSREIIHSAIDTKRFAPGPASSDTCFPKILFVGNLVGSKGIEVLVDAVLALRGRFPEIRLRAIGKGGAHFVDGLKARIQGCSAESHFDFAGYVPYSDLPGHYHWCDLFAGPSTYEPGPGNIYLEAMSCARPVIACNTGGAPEVVLDGETGLLVPAGDAGALADAIARLAAESGLRGRLGAAGRRWIESRFTAEKYIDRVESIYRSIL